MSGCQVPRVDPRFQTRMSGISSRAAPVLSAVRPKKHLRAAAALVTAALGAVPMGTARENRDNPRIDQLQPQLAAGALQGVGQHGTGQQTFTGTSLVTIRGTQRVTVYGTCLAS